MKIIKTKTQRSLSKMEYEIISKLSLLNVKIITIDDIAGIFRIKKEKLWVILHRLEKKGWMERIEKGKYMLVPFKATTGWLLHPFILASGLAKKYYISYRTALAHYAMTEQIPFYVYIVITERKKKLRHELQNYVLEFVRVKKNKFFGFKTEFIGDKNVFIAEKEKAIVDCLDKEKYTGSIIEVVKALSSKDIKLKVLKKYALKMKNASLIRRLGYLLDILKKDSSGLQKHIGKFSNIYLSNIFPKKNYGIDSKWNIIINVKKEDLLTW